MLDIDAYFRRIGYSGSREPTLETLRALHAHHPLAIPFENLDSLRRRPVQLDLESLQRKLVAERRGGYCFEQNLFFSHVLATLGFQVMALSARVLWERPEDVRARTHMLLFVELGEGAYLCDVGFGGFTMTAPLRLEPGVEQGAPHDVFRVLREGREFLSPGSRGWQLAHALPLRPAAAAASRHRAAELLGVGASGFAVPHALDGCASQWRPHLLAAQQPAQRVLLEWEKEQREFRSVSELRAVLAETFGIDVPLDANLDAALERVLG